MDASRIAEIERNTGVLISLWDNQLNDVSYDKCTQIHIVQTDSNGYWLVRFDIKKPIRKEFNEAFVLDAVERELNKKNAQKTDWSKIFGNIAGLRFYSTTYGVGIFSFFGQIENHVQEMKDKLDSLGIEYSNEYSDARWVYRFRISKSAENVARINALQQ